MRIDFGIKPVYGDDNKYLQTKIIIYAGSMVTNFHNKKIPEAKAPCKFLSIIILDSVIKVNKKYYPQRFLDECKCVQEKMKNEIIGSDSNEECDE